jgi:hypothetical protein
MYEDIGVDVKNDLFKQTEKDIKLFFNSCETSSFNWSDVFDHLSSGDDKFNEIKGETNTKYLSIHGSPEGLFLIPGALSAQEQLSWAKQSLEVYSLAEHTNLTNLTKNQEHIERKNAPAELLKSESHGCWLGADKSNRFHSFLKLRWSCLGYHYGCI